MGLLSVFQRNSFRIIFFIFIALSVLLIGVFIFHQSFSNKATYVTSSNCRECHAEQYSSWRNNTLHPYMFLPVKHPDAKILGDFSQNNEVVTFKKEEIEYVIGSKWEQIYARMIDGEYYPFPAKWYVLQKKWVPYKKDTWRKTPLSYKCNGCHTTGFDPNTLKFAEFGIGCEACHGPGSLHVLQKKKIKRSICDICHDAKSDNTSGYQYIVKDLSTSVCGQCHNRGTSPIGDAIKSLQFNFPVDYKPGGNLKTSKFNPSTPANDKKKKNWWGNGLSKNRHQELSDWFNSPHSKSLINMIIGQSKDPNGCGRTSSPCMECHSTDYRHATGNNKPDIYNVKFGVTCVACHEPHGNNNKQSGNVNMRSKCIDCHTSITGDRYKDHYPCKAKHIQCNNCHMPHIVKSGGFFSLASHALKIVPPEATNGKMPNSCQNAGCHEDKNLDWAIKTYKNYYDKTGSTK